MLELSLFMQVVGAVVLVQAGFFLIAWGARTDKLTDLSYGGTFVVVVLWLYRQIPSPSFWQGMVTVLVTLWGVRLAGYLFWRILTMGRDQRFDSMRDKRYEFGKFWLLQAVTIVILIFPVLIVLGQSELGALRSDVWSRVGLVVFAAGWLLETIADRQKFRYKRTHPDHRVDSGVRSKARHPNYFGEMLVWWGIWLISLPFLSGWGWISLISPVMITLLLRYVSGIPPLEEQHGQKYGDDPAYQDYLSRTRLLVPW